ncbi:hypothetical protein LRP88_04148 [Fusarium phalaenopsidis]|nr:Amidohydro-3 domain-containing protein [Fusarium sp. Ph1]
MASTSSSTGTLLVNGRIFTKGGTGLEAQPEFADSIFVQDGIIKSIGSRDELSTKHQHEAAHTQDLDGKTVLPGFVDGHMHLLQLGQSLQKLSLDYCQSLEEIVETIRSFAKANPDLPRILAMGWAINLTPDGVHAKTLDEIDSRPIYVDALDLHSVWCNSAAIAELGVGDMSNPEGGEIHRYDDGSPTGLLSENVVFGIVVPFLAQILTKSQRMQYMLRAFEEYSASGYTGAVEMAMDEVAWDALSTLFSERPDIAVRMTVYWLIKPDTEALIRRQVDRAIELHRQFNRETSPNLTITGIKLICDGTIDACTAYLSEPYAVAPSAPPLWSDEKLVQVVQHASEAGLQIALHAIGDKAIHTAINALETHTKPGSRHRIEHLEFSAPEDARRLGSLGITASIQPVHADPMILVDWPRLIGTHRCKRAFAYRDFADSGALLAIGSDTPTAPWDPLRNLYVATTRRSARRPEWTTTVNENFRLGLCEAVTAATFGAAKSVFAEDRVGSLEVGKAADFAVLNLEWDAEKLLGASVEQTWFNGKRVYQKATAKE